jgi:hypothetical protein
MLNNQEISMVKGMLARGDKQHDIAAFFKINGGRVAEIATGRQGSGIKAMQTELLPALENGPRYIDPNAAIEKQIAVLDALRRNPPENPRRVTVTPKLAQYILNDLNPHNRPTRSSHIVQYAEDMGVGRWKLTGDTIKFGRSGILRDGQHRLAACIRSGMNFETYIVFGIDDESFSVMDTGRKRKGDDVFAIAGITNSSSASAAVRWVLILSSDQPTNRAMTYSNNDLLDTYRGLKQPLFDNCVAEAKAACKTARVLHETALAGILYLFRQKHDKAASAFIADLKAMKGGAKKLVNLIEKIRSQRMGRIHENQRNAMIIKALHAYAKGVAPTAATLAWDDTKDFPVI